MEALLRRHLSADFELHPLYLDRVYKDWEIGCSCSFG